MTDAEDVNVLYEQVVLASGKNREEIAKLVLKKQEKFSGLLTESGALFLVAKELGVNVPTDSSYDAGSRETALISELKANDRVKKMIVDVVAVYPKRMFDKNGRKGQVQNVLVKDDTGSMMWTLWNDTVTELEKEGLSRQTKLELHDVVIRSREDRVSMQLDNGGKFQVVEKSILLPVTLADVHEGDQDIIVDARLVQKFPPKSFEKNDRKGQLGKFVLNDGNKQMNGVAWNDAVLQLELIPTGSLIRVENAYAKNNLNGEVELQIGWQGRLIVLEAGVETKREMTVQELSPQKTGLVRGVLMELDCLKSYYEACQTCGKKVEKMGEEYHCAKCGKTTFTPRAMAKFLLKDETGEIQVVAFGNEAEKVWGKSGKELHEMSVEELEEWAKTKNDGIVAVEGMVRENSYTGRMEMTAQRVD